MTQDKAEQNYLSIKEKYKDLGPDEMTPSIMVEMLKASMDVTHFPELVSRYRLELKVKLLMGRHNA